MRTALALLGLWLSVSAATLEQLTLEEMSQKATLIVRGRVTGCAGEVKGSLIQTRCRVTVTDRWKGTSGADLSFVTPGGTAGGLVQTFTGTPKFSPGAEYVLFLWTGRSGVPQIIGLSQGVFDVAGGAKGPTVRREASSEVMVNSAGERIVDQPTQMSVADLRARVAAALGGQSK